MSAEILEIKDKGDYKKERIVLKALTNLNIGDYIVFFTKKLDNDRFLSTPKKVFWFPEKEIKKNDFIVLYTKNGKISEKQIKNNNLSHFFYWGLDNSIFNNDDDVVILIESLDWIMK